MAETRRARVLRKAKQLEARGAIITSRYVLAPRGSCIECDAVRVIHDRRTKASR